MEEQKILSEQPTKKKISFFAAMLIVMGGSIGAGIFFKSSSVLGNSHSSLVLAIFCWLIASCAVIAMALALIEVASVRNDNLSLIGWTKVFTSRRIFKASKNFMVYVYLPLTYFFMPLYVIMSLQDGLGALINGGTLTLGTNVDWLIWLVISLVMSVYFLVVPALWSKIGDVQNKIVLAIKFIPLVGVTLIGFILAFAGKGGTSDVHALVQDQGNIQNAIKMGKGIASFSGIGAGLGVFLAISAIFFAYDGFYVASGIQSEMKEPKKTPLALFLGLGITTIIYVVIAISMSINGGSFFGMWDYMKSWWGEKAGNIVFGILNLCIAIGVLGIINGFSMWAPRYVEDLLKEGELPFWEKLKGKLNDNKPVVGVIYSLVLTIPIVILFTVIGAVAYLPTNPDYVFYSEDARLSMGRLYAFADLMANWTALFTFAFIGASIHGALLNRKTNKIHIEDKKSYFKPAAILAVIIIYISLFVMVIVPFIDAFLLIGFDKTVAGSTQFEDLVVGRVMLIVTLFIFLGLSFLPTEIEDAIHKNKYGSIEKYEEYVKNHLL
ncbi:APC family permease [Mycoplasmopsis lipofaciens]|uniref:APC family permease n=1 Tax=Mycoplasmopsis lipofaciens TaxID=114884 RepID=UPI000561E463|nr:APC family permease [Mycoplasmopsis lipofaciens]